MSPSLIDTLCDQLRRHDVFAERVEAMCDALRAPAPAAASGHGLAAQWNARLQAVSPDRHLRVRWFEQAPVEWGNDDDEPAQRQRRTAAEIDHQGIHRVERLAGQVGLIELREFHPLAAAAPAIAAAMNLLAPSRALLVDLRRCRGGEAETVAWVCSHLFGQQAVHLNDLYSRPDNRTQSFWTRPEAVSTRLPDVPVYVLCSSQTFSAGEEFAYDLQALQRATTVGETTWEGRGVVPDVPCPAAQALAVAHAMALEAVRARLGAESDSALDALRGEIDAALAAR